MESERKLILRPGKCPHCGMGRPEMTGRQISIDLPFLPPGLNGSKGLKRMHYRTYMDLRDKLTLMVRSEFGAGDRIEGPVRVNYFRRCISAMDWDNLGASFKLPGDALVRAGVLLDDNPNVITEWYPNQERVPYFKEQGFSVVITEL